MTHISLVPDLWRFAAAASQPQLEQCLPEGGQVTRMRNDLHECMVYEDDLRIIAAFAGTLGTVPDWLENFRIRTNRDGLHTGFADGSEMFEPSLCELMRGAREKKRAAIGHSQGGGIAGAFAFRCERYHHMPIDYPVTFGSPPYAQDERCVPNMLRVVVIGDPVECRGFPGVRRAGSLHFQGPPGGDVCPLLNHDYASYSWAIKQRCLRIGDAEGARAMDELLEHGGHTWRKLECI